MFCRTRCCVGFLQVQPGAEGKALTSRTDFGSQRESDPAERQTRVSTPPQLSGAHDVLLCRPVPPSTKQILAEKALDMTCGQTCVDWAAGLIEAGSDSMHMAMLAGMSPPFNHFEVASRRDQALTDLGITPVSKSDAVRAWAAEYLRHAWEGGASRRSALRTISALTGSPSATDV